MKGIKELLKRAEAYLEGIDGYKPTEGIDYSEYWFHGEDKYRLLHMLGSITYSLLALAQLLSNEEIEIKSKKKK